MAVLCWTAVFPSSAPAQDADIPPLGRSLFDIVTTASTPDGPRLRVPFPFSELRALIRKTGALGPADIAETLIPIGRSLQREAAAPDYFASPRRVLGVVAEPDASAPGADMAPILKDRLYLGYQPKAEAIEVISFNEEAGRFEFQVVEDYAPGKTPRVAQARRALCLACHGNAGPIFPEPPWSETQANPSIARNLAGAGAAAPPEQADPKRHAETAAALYRSVGSANLLLHANRFWTQSCAEKDKRRRCQENLLSTILEHRLLGRRLFGKGDYQTRRSTEIHFSNTQSAAWPDGFAIADPYLDDIDPTRPAGAAGGTRGDPLAPRAPLRVLDVGAPHANDGIVAMLSDAFTDRGIRWLDTALFTLARNLGVESRIARVPCVFTAQSRKEQRPVSGFSCSNRVPGFPKMSGSLYLGDPDGPSLAIDGLRIELVDYSDIRAGAAKPSGGYSAGGRVVFEPIDPETGLHPRTGDAWVIASIEMSWPASGSGDGQAVFTSLNDIGRLRSAMRVIPGYREPGAGRPATDGGMRGRDIMRAVAARLGRPAPGWCCAPEAGLPPPVGPQDPGRLTIDGLSMEPGPAHPSLQAFHRACGACHAGSGSAPPNFLFGSGGRQLRAIADCAPRILSRIRRSALKSGTPSPMPPASHLAALGQTREAWLESADFRRIERFTTGLSGNAGSTADETATRRPVCGPRSE